ncbi:MAG: tRNA (adenosine(37)-N6)-threonylcarbamoyltransferase complex ATPase subunit type 1 TsaE [Peptococcaceae bacterium]|nr:tRNA (adenosine(37)-N6)-threonylcarbamoyltransferase complex ATPase subunit type 1 TsaE [Peptococcaceae bacterium]
MLTCMSRSPDETCRLGEALGRMAGPGDVFCLSGDLGTGKTVFARGVAAGLGVAGRVASPTFTLINEHQGRVPFYHMDVYRLGGPGEMHDLGCEEYFYGGGVTLVEWADLVDEVLPGERLDISITRAGDQCRQIVFTPRGERYRRLVEEMKKFVRAGN